jgi:hypothetical protein
MSYALLSEVWPDMEINTSIPSKKKKKSKKNKENLSPLITEVSEMESELLSDNNNDNEQIEKLRGFNLGTYTDKNTLYQNPNIVRPSENLPIIRRNKLSQNTEPVLDYRKDPEYLEFLKSKSDKRTNEEQFNELLLYIFTGFFLLMLYDSIYKLGKSYND